jgi:hypothetical protein
MAVATNSLLFTEQFEGATLNANRWSTTATTMTVSQTTLVGLTFNAANIVTTTTGIMAKSLRTFMRPFRSITHIKFRARLEHYVGSTMEIGIGDATTNNGAHSNGYYLQVTNSGTVQLVWTFNGNEVTSAPITGLSGNIYYTFDIIIDDDQASLYVQDTSTGIIIAERNIFLSVTSPKQFTSSRLFAFARQFHTGAPATAPHIFLSLFDIVLIDNMQNKDWGTTSSSIGQSSAFNPATGAALQNWTNSAAPASASLSNTIAGYTTLGGFFQFAAVAGAATDYALFGFTVPSPYSFHCTGIDIDTWNTGAAVATTPTLLVWGIGINQSAVSLATSGIGKLTLGGQSFPIGAAVGSIANRISSQFKEPKITDAGRFMTIILRMPVGTATAAQIIQGLVTIHGYFE